MEIKKVLNKNGDCVIAVVNKCYKVLVRIDERNYQTIFGQKVNSALEFIDERLQAGDGIDLAEIPKDVYQHFTVSCKKDYNMTNEEVKTFEEFLNSGYKSLYDACKIQIEKEEMIVSIVTLSLFLEFRKKVLGFLDFPEIEFAIPQPKKDEKLIVLDSAETLTEILKRPIGEA